MARPKITTKDFPPDWETQVLLLFAEGASRVEVQAYLDIADGTWARLMREDKMFLRTIKKGLRFCEAWWQKQGRTSMRDKDFNCVLWYMNMKNRFGWRDKQDITTGGETITKNLTKKEAAQIAQEIQSLYGNKDVGKNATESGATQGVGGE